MNAELSCSFGIYAKADSGAPRSQEYIQDTGIINTHPSFQETVGFKALVPIFPFTMNISWKFQYFRAEILTQIESTQVISSPKFLCLGEKRLPLHRSLQS